MTVAIRCRGIKKTYGNDENKVEALKSTDLDINFGQLTLIVGPSGSGKTTLISIIATILTPDEGELILLDRQMNGLSGNEKALFRCKHIGFVFQSLFLIPSLSIVENVALPLIVAGMHEKLAIVKAMEMLEKVHLAHRANEPPTKLSKGQQQRVAIVRAMINDAEIIICDEPTSSLDHTSGFEIMEFLHTLAKNSTKAVVVVTHDPRIFSYADHIIPMSDGELTMQEAVHEQKLL
ncbi:MAG: ABC transporter ATP-binding protein [Parachlamydiaceae bacterium]|nr:ABC transporter ATP-binding protein [Parachlamydiaceae bacterium]